MYLNSLSTSIKLDQSHDNQKGLSAIMEFSYKGFLCQRIDRLAIDPHMLIYQIDKTNYQNLTFY